MRDWSSQEGRLVQGWRLESFLGIRGDKAFYIAREDDSNARLLELTTDSGEQPLASWKRARDVAKANLLRVYAAGEVEIDGENSAFAVLDLPDDDLGEIIAKGPLDPEEARAIFSAVASGLAALHKRGLFHGAVVPSNIFIVNDEVRLSVDTIWNSGRLGEESDLRQFGAMLVCALTGRTDVPGIDDPALLDAVAQLGPPFYDIAVGCFRGASDRRWTAQRIVDALSGRWAPPSSNSDGRVTTPDAEAAPIRASERRAASKQVFARWLSGPQWPITGTAAIVGIILIVYLAVHGPRPHKAPAASAPPVQSVTAPPAPAAPQNPEPDRSESGAASRAVPRAHSANWAVIAATYGSYGAAQKRADRIRKQAPRLEPHVVPPEGQGKHYYIVLGSGLTQSEAERLLRNVRSMGAPRDSYVTKLNLG